MSCCWTTTILSNFAARWKNPRSRSAEQAAGRNTGKVARGNPALAGVAVVAGGRAVDPAGPGAQGRGAPGPLMPIPGSAARLLAPEDNLLQIALHTAKHSYVRAPGFRLHTDVDRVVRRQPLNWDLFLTRVIALEVKTPVFFSLAIPRSLFGTPIPDEVLAQLQPHPWKLALITKWLQSGRAV